jgi:hypothetical protein
MLREGISRRGRVNEESKEEWICSMYFLHMYKYESLRLVEVIVRKGMWEEGE